MVGQHDAPHAEEGGGAHNGAEIVRIANPIEQQKQTALARPIARLRGIESMHRPRPRDRHHAAMHRSAGDAGKLIGVDQAIGFSQPPQGGAKAAHPRLGALLEEQPLDPFGRGGEQRRHRGVARDAGGRLTVVTFGRRPIARALHVL